MASASEEGRRVMKSETLVSVIVVVDRRNDALQSELAGIQAMLDEHFEDYEILLLVQGPAQLYLAEAQVNEILGAIPRVRLIQLAYNVNRDVLKAAGIENAIGDFVVIFDPASDPLDVVAKAVSMCQAGSDIVIGVSPTGPSLAYRIARFLISGLLHIVDYRIPANDTGFRCVSRRAINAVIDTGRFYHQLNQRLQKTGYRSVALPYEPTATTGPRKSLAAALPYFFHVLVFSSSRPLRWMSAIGLLGSGIALLFALYGVAVRLFFKGVVEGWTTTVLFMSIQFMLIFIILAFISEYLGRILDEQRGTADYAIVYERNSSVMVNDGRINVMDDSLPSELNRVKTARNG